MSKEEFITLHFPGTRPDLVASVSIEAHRIDFPRSMYCSCQRCTSHLLERVVVGQNITAYLVTGEELYDYLPVKYDLSHHGVSKC